MKHINSTEEKLIKEAVHAELRSLERSPGKDAWDKLVTQLEGQTNIKSKRNRPVNRFRVLTAASLVLLIGSAWWISSSVMRQPVKDENRILGLDESSLISDTEESTSDLGQYTGTIGGFMFEKTLDNFRGKAVPEGVSCFLFNRGESSIVLIKTRQADAIPEFLQLNLETDERTTGSLFGEKEDTSPLVLIDRNSGRNLITWKDHDLVLALYPLDDRITAGELKDIWSDLQK